MAIANAISYGQYFHQLGYDYDPSDIADLLTAWPLWLCHHDLCAPIFLEPVSTLAARYVIDILCLFVLQCTNTLKHLYRAQWSTVSLRLLILCCDINKTRQGISFICCTLYVAICMMCCTGL